MSWKYCGSSEFPFAYLDTGDNNCWVQMRDCESLTRYLLVWSCKTEHSMAWGRPWGSGNPDSILDWPCTPLVTSCKPFPWRNPSWTLTVPRMKSKILARPLPSPWPNLLPHFPSTHEALCWFPFCFSLIECVPTSWPLYLQFPLSGMSFRRYSNGSLLCFLWACSSVTKLPLLTTWWKKHIFQSKFSSLFVYLFPSVSSQRWRPHLLHSQLCPQGLEELAVD